MLEGGGDTFDHGGIGAEFRAVEPVEIGLRQFVVQRGREQRHQHGKPVAVDRGHNGDKLIEDILLLLRVTLQQRADVERNAHMIEADPPQLIEIEQRQRRQRARIGRIGVSFLRAVTYGFGKLEEFDERRAALERRRRSEGNSRQARKTRKRNANRDCRGGEPRKPPQG